MAFSTLAALSDVPLDEGLLVLAVMLIWPAFWLAIAIRKYIATRAANCSAGPGVDLVTVTPAHEGEVLS
jgi:hypothetical protein